MDLLKRFYKHSFQENAIGKRESSLCNLYQHPPSLCQMRALEQYMGIHQIIKDRGISSNVVVATALVDVYAKIESMDRARELFNKMPKKMWPHGMPRL